MLKINNINMNYGKKTALKDVSFEVKEGGICAVLGLNGAGKSTLLKIISGLIYNFKGEVLFDKENISQKEIVIGFMIEQPTFYEDISAYKNLLLLSTLFDNIKKERIDEVLSIVGLSKSKNMKVKSFSLGMKQRLHFAYSIINQPQILVLDEPFNGIDPITNKIFKELIIDMSNAGVTILITSHVIPDINDISDQVIIIDQGMIIYNQENNQNNNLQDLFIKLVSHDGNSQ